jgi:PAS domain S-box-containing protein
VTHAGDDLWGARPDLSVLAERHRVARVERLVARVAGGRLDALCALIADVMEAPVCQVSLLTGSEHIIAAAHGLPEELLRRSWALDDSLCAVTVAAAAPLVVEDARRHGWVRDLPSIRNGEVRGYLGVPLRDSTGVVVGALSVSGHDPRSWTPQQVAQLTRFGKAVELDLEQQAADHGETAVRTRLQLAAAAADLGSYDYDLSTGELVWDERMRTLHGYDASRPFPEAIGGFDAVVHPDDLIEINSQMAQAIEEVGELVLEYRVVLPDGSYRWINARGRVVPDLAGRAARIVGAAYDRSPERGLRDELTRLLETMPAGFLRCDNNWVITFVNAVAEGLAGTPRAQLVGTTLWDAFPAEGSAFDVEYRRARRTGQPGKVEAFFSPLNAHFEVHAWPDDQGLSLFFHDVSDSKRAQQALELASERLSVLAGAGAQLTSTLQPLEVLTLLADLIVPKLANFVVLAVVSEVAELLGVPTTGDPDRLYVVHTKHTDPSLQQVLEKIVAAEPFTIHAPHGVGYAVRTQQTQSFPRVPEELIVERTSSPDTAEAIRSVNTGPSLATPLRSSSRVLGALSVGASSDDVGLDELLLVDIANRAAVALDNALDFAREQRAAHDLQIALLPKVPREVPDVQVATRYLPARTGSLAGGDFFKSVLVDGRLVTVLGDVMGHGTASAARAGQLHALVAALALEGHGPAALLTRLAAGVDQMMDLELATLLVCSYDAATRILTSASAGHPPPLFAPVAGQPYYLDIEPGAPIGVFAGDYDEVHCELERGATTVLFTDGLVERRGESLSVGLERLRQALNELRLPPEAVAAHVLRSLDREQGGDDDIALVVLCHI